MLLALGTGHDGTFFYCSGHFVKHCGHWTLNRLLILLTRTTQKNYSKTMNFSFEQRMPINKYPMLTPVDINNIQLM